MSNDLHPTVTPGSTRDHLRPPGGPDRLLRNARIAGGPSGVRDLLVTGGVVTFAADAPSGVEALDLDGRWVLPGLADRHAHLVHWAKTSRRLDLSGARTASAAVERVAAALAGGAAEVVGYGFRDALWPERPGVAALDAVSGDRLVVLVSGDLHCAWLNSAALRRHGLGPTDDLVREEPAFAVMGELEDVSDETIDAWVLDALHRAAGRGTTRITDVEMAWSFEAWPRRTASGLLPVRIAAGFYPVDLDRAVSAGLRTGEPVPGTAGRVSVGPLKIITDGSLNTRTAWCFDPYPGLGADENPYGVASVPYADLLPLLRRARANSLRVAVHAIGDRANKAALDAFAESGAQGSIEHAQLLRHEDVARFAELGVVASVQPEHAMDDRDVADRHWAGRTDRAFMLRELHEAGVPLALGSDAPVAPLDPWITIAAAVTRSRDGREPWHPEQAIDVATALAASTDGAGVLREGAPAELAVVERDPFACSGEELRTMPVFATMLDGDWTYRAG
jgi:predicted amidohydrolase YtcJ